jgi:hypothetical protein
VFPSDPRPPQPETNRRAETEFHSQKPTKPDRQCGKDPWRLLRSNRLDPPPSLVIDSRLRLSSLALLIVPLVNGVAFGQRIRITGHVYTEVDSVALLGMERTMRLRFSGLIQKLANLSGKCER